MGRYIAPYNSASFNYGIIAYMGATQDYRTRSYPAAVLNYYWRAFILIRYKPIEGIDVIMIINTHVGAKKTVVTDFNLKPAGNDAISVKANIADIHLTKTAF